MINHEAMPGAVVDQLTQGSPPDNVTEVYSNINTHMHLTTHINFGFGPQRNGLDTAGTADDYQTQSSIHHAAVMNRTQDIGRFTKRNLIMNKTMSQMPKEEYANGANTSRKRGESDNRGKINIA